MSTPKNNNPTTLNVFSPFRILFPTMLMIISGKLLVLVYLSQLLCLSWLLCFPAQKTDESKSHQKEVHLSPETLAFIRQSPSFVPFTSHMHPAPHKNCIVEIAPLQVASRVQQSTIIFPRESTCRSVIHPSHSSRSSVHLNNYNMERCLSLLFVPLFDRL